ncbi:MAG: hypothetical protein ACKO23_21645 [Gemmataceae bacterium]
MLCRHCQKVRPNRPRGLCWSCYYKPGVRDQFPSTSKYARRGLGNGCRRPALADRPTNALPGTEEKLRVLEDRASRGLSLWHPQDAGLLPHTVVSPAPLQEAMRPAHPLSSAFRNRRAASLVGWAKT